MNKQPDLNPVLSERAVFSANFKHDMLIDADVFAREGDIVALIGRLADVGDTMDPDAVKELARGLGGAEDTAELPIDVTAGRFVEIHIPFEVITSNIVGVVLFPENTEYDGDFEDWI